MQIRKFVGEGKWRASYKNVLCWHYSEGTKYENKRRQPGLPHYEPKFEILTS